jgi:hypothetical protein
MAGAFSCRKARVSRAVLGWRVPLATRWVMERGGVGPGGSGRSGKGSSR